MFTSQDGVAIPVFEAAWPNFAFISNQVIFPFDGLAHIGVKLFLT